jgi:hypothetical protein
MAKGQMKSNKETKKPKAADKAKAAAKSGDPIKDLSSSPFKTVPKKG